MLSSSSVERSYASAIDDAVRGLTIRAQVASVMEGMLDDLEVWEWVNKTDRLEAALRHARAQVEALKKSERLLLEREALAKAKAEAQRLEARDLRETFIRELWGLAREFRARAQEQRKMDQLSKKLAELEGVQKGLDKAERKIAKLQLASRGSLAAADGVGVVGGAGDSTSVPLSKLSQGLSSTEAGEVREQGRGVMRIEEPVVNLCPFLELEDKPLLKMFSYLNAPEVLGTAQVCLFMFQKV
ncbi:unnamed protein product, partial [Discosporangium mesarthrocarpum]